MLMVGGAVLASVAAVVISAYRPLTSLEQTLFQILTLVLSLIGSADLGMRWAKAATEEQTRLQARTGLRRVLTLYASVARFGQLVEERRSLLGGIAMLSRNNTIPMTHVDQALDLLAVASTEQLGTASAALEDWRDLLPDEVEKLAQRAEALSGDTDASK
jgi:hypothetical protein